jgi:hypothetical protein
VGSDKEKIFEQGAWAIGTISQEDESFKERLQIPDIINPLIKKLMTTNDEKVSKNTCWALTCVASGKSLKEKLELRYAVYTALMEMLKKHTDESTLDSILSTLLDLTSNDSIKLLIQGRCLQRFHQLLQANVPNIVHKILQIICYITNGTNEETQEVINSGLVEHLFVLLTNPSTDNYSKKECLWTIANILVGTPEQLQFIFQNQQWINILFQQAYDPVLMVVVF